MNFCFLLNKFFSFLILCNENKNDRFHKAKSISRPINSCFRKTRLYGKIINSPFWIDWIKLFHKGKSPNNESFNISFFVNNRFNQVFRYAELCFIMRNRLIISFINFLCQGLFFF